MQRQLVEIFEVHVVQAAGEGNDFSSIMCECQRDTEEDCGAAVGAAAFSQPNLDFSVSR